MEDDKNNKYEGILILIIFSGMLLFIGFCLLNSATDGILFAKTLECPEGKYKIIADFTPTEDYWQIQPDGSYATCMCYGPDPNYFDLNSELGVYFDDLSTFDNERTVMWEGNISTIPSTIKYEIPRNKPYKITFSNDGEQLPFNPEHWACYDINNNEIPCTYPLSNDTVMIII